MALEASGLALSLKYRACSVAKGPWRSTRKHELPYVCVCVWEGGGGAGGPRLS